MFSFNSEKSLVVDEIELASGTSNSSISDFDSTGNSSFDKPAHLDTLQNEELVNRLVRPVDVDIRNLTVVYRPGDLQTHWQSLQTLCQRLLPRTTKAHDDLEHAKPRLSSTKTILDDVSANMAPGTLTAILGGSGSGKTTLLNTVAQRAVGSNLEITGEMKYSGASHDCVRTAYVMQQDLLQPDLTVRETLQFAADLRLASLSNSTQRKAVVERVISELGLKECADTRIGSSIHKGCPGGEKRRVSIAVQMLSNPSVLFCDEPTTGLDAYSAYQVVSMLKRLAEKGRTVVVSIHTPRSEIVALFDNVILLSQGSVLYSGPVTEASFYFTNHGYTIGEFVNPADFMIDLAALDTRDGEHERVSTARVQYLRQAWKERYAMLEKTIGTVISTEIAEVDILSEPKKVRFRRQVEVLTRRGFKVALRDPLSVAGMAFGAVSISFVQGCIFYQLPGDQAGIRSRTGALYSAFGLWNYLILLVEIHRLVPEFRMFDLERAEGSVSVSAFLLSRRMSRLFLEDIPMPLIYLLVFYFMVGFRAEAANFFMFFFIMVLTHYVAIAFATLCVAISRSFAGASLFANLMHTANSLSGGYFVNANQMPVYTQWLTWISSHFYLFSAFVTNEFIGYDNSALGQLYDCPLADKSHSECALFTGRYIVKGLSLRTEKSIWVPVVVVIGFILGWFSLAAGFLATRKGSIDVTGPHKTKDTETLVEPQTQEALRRDVPSIRVGLRNYALEVRTRGLLKKGAIKTILHPLSADFTPGQLNVIMGPSGSGKTSLLAGLANRLSGSFSSKYEASGTIKLNDMIASASDLRSVTSFVAQDDDALMPSLTVRETLRYAALMRLPPCMSVLEKERRAEEVLLKMGLKPCAGRPVGDELKKGISGGEKRRVSIAVQILTDPRILLLDEPTSGLDAFLAASVITFLKSLADEGRTIIFTIHQARSDLIKEFHSVLLLARGGSLVYTEPTDEMLPYFAKLGHQCPPGSNPADFVLDTITVDLAEETKEAASREKVHRMIQAWQEREKEPSLDMMKDTKGISSAAELNSLKREMNPFSTVFPLLLERSIINIKRNPNIIVARTMQVISYALILALFFAPLQNNYEAIQSRIGFIQEITPLYYIGMLQNLAVYPLFQSIFLREHADGCYNPLTFLLSYSVLEAPFTLLSSLVFGLLAAYVDNAAATPTFCFAVAANCFCIITNGESLGIVFSALFPNHTGLGITLTSTLISISVTMTGLFSLHMPPWLKALNWISPLRYSVGNLVVWMLRGQVFTCEESQRGKDGRCKVETGEQVLGLYGMDADPRVMLAGLVGCTIVYRAVAFGVVCVLRRR